MNLTNSIQTEYNEIEEIFIGMSEYIRWRERGYQFRWGEASQRWFMCLSLNKIPANASSLEPMPRNIHIVAADYSPEDWEREL